MEKKLNTVRYDKDLGHMIDYTKKGKALRSFLTVSIELSIGVDLYETPEAVKVIIYNRVRELLDTEELPFTFIKGDYPYEIPPV